MTTTTPSSRTNVPGPPTKHVHTFVLVTVAVPIVIYVLMPQLHRIRGRLLAGLPGR
jgi:hypothetical protein